MFPRIPRAIFNEPAYGPLLAHMDGLYLTPKELAARWRYSEDHLSNLRKSGRGVPWIRLPTGGIRYKYEDILRAEFEGTAGPLTLDAVLVAVSAAKGVPKDHRAAVIDHLKSSFGPEKED